MPAKSSAGKGGRTVIQGKLTDPKKPKALPKTAKTSERSSSRFFGNAPQQIAPDATPPGLMTGPGGQLAMTPTPTAAVGGTPSGATGGGGGNVGAPSLQLNRTDVGGGTGAYTDAAMLSGFLGDHPEVAAADALAAMGITSPEMVNMVADLMQYAPAMYMLTQGADAGFNTSPQQEGQYLLDLANSLMGTGGGGMSLDNLLGAILNADPNSALGSYLSTLGPDGVNQLVGVAARMGTSNPYFQNAIMNQADQSALGYNRDFAHGNVSDPDAYIAGLRGGWLGQYF